MLIEAEQSVLVIVDVQPRLLRVMDAARQVIDGCALLLKGAAEMKVPAIVSEQYPEGLGPTVDELAELAPDTAFHSKTAFSCAADPAIRAWLDASARRQAVIGGIEAHVCVLQTALDLKSAGYDVFVVGDATSARRPASVAAALARMRDGGITIVTAEMVLFEWLRRAGTPAFKRVSALLK